MNDKGLSCPLTDRKFRRVDLTYGFWIAVACLLGGCRVAEETARIPTHVMTAVVPGVKSKPKDPAQLQTEVMHYADEFASRTVAALEEYARRAGTTEARYQALKWKVGVGAATTGIASGPNPTANLVDFISLATISRAALEQVSAKSATSNAFEPWLATSRTLEADAWKLASGTLTPVQQRDLRDRIQQWWETNSGSPMAFFIRPQEFSSLIRQSAEKSGSTDSLFGLVGLDPTAGLDPAVREVTRTRLFAERAMFTAQRMTFLLRWQIELLTAELLVQQPVTEMINSADRLSRAAESASQTAAILPDRVTAERKALLAALETQEGKLRELSAEVGRTLSAGERMSTSLNTTLVTFDALMKRFGVGEPSATPPDTNAPAFNILDYAKTAEQVALMAQQLDGLMKEMNGTLDSPALNKHIASLDALADRTRADAKSVLNHAFLLAAGLVLFAFACAWGYRRARTRPSS